MRVFPPARRSLLFARRMLTIYDAVVPATGQKLQLIRYNVNAGGKNFNVELRTINEGRLIRATAR